MPVEKPAHCPTTCRRRPGTVGEGALAVFGVVPMLDSDPGRSRGIGDSEMRQSGLVAAVGVAAAMVLGCGSDVSPAAPEGSAEVVDVDENVFESELQSGGPSGLTQQQLHELVRLRKLTRKYRDVSVALAEGFVPAGGCVESPEGAMGYHYIHFGRLLAPVDPYAPAGLVYAPAGKSGNLKLAAVEYFVSIFQDGAPYTAETPPLPSSIPPTPSVFGMAFDGPMPGHEPGMPWHFDKHIWIWRPNPLGIGYMWNPNVRCPVP